MPRCASDGGDNFVHLTRFEDITLVANKYFTMEENPVVLDVDIKDFEDKIVWIELTSEKPWNQPGADIENIEWRHIKKYAPLITIPGNENHLFIGEFNSPNDKDVPASGIR